MCVYYTFLSKALVLGYVLIIVALSQNDIKQFNVLNISIGDYFE